MNESIGKQASNGEIHIGDRVGVGPLGEDGYCYLFTVLVESACKFRVITDYDISQDHPDWKEYESPCNVLDRPATELVILSPLEASTKTIYIKVK